MMDCSNQDTCKLLCVSDCEIAADDFAVVEHGGRQLGDDPPLVHDVAALRHGADHIDILFDKDDGQAGLAVQFDDDARDVLHDRRLNAFGRLVEQQQRRLADEHPPDRELLLLAA